MKVGLVTSASLHAVILGIGLISLSAPRPFEVADVEAFPVDIVPIETLTQIQQGDRRADLSERPAPTPTRRPDPVENAERVGEADADMTTPPTPEVRPRPVEQAAEPPPPPPAPTPAERPVQETRQAEAAPAPPEPEPPAPPSEPQVAEAAPEPEHVQLPQSAPIPQARPQPPRTETARAPEPRREPETQTARAPERQETPPQRTQTPSEQRNDQLLDQVAALLDRQQASGGGAQRSTEEASLGGNRSTGGERLSQSELDSLRDSISRCWNVPAGVIDAQDLKVSFRFRLDPSGSVDGMPQLIAGGSGSNVERAAAESARRAILRCAPYNLPAERYSAWSEVTVHFDPKEMF